jgi:VanZ family protein
VTLRYRSFWLACGAAFMSLVVFLSLTPDPPSTPTLETVKTGHVLAYAWLMLWFSQIYRGTLVRAGIALALVALGVGLEYAQALTGYRTFAFSDMVDDAIGVAIGFVLGSGPGAGMLEMIEGLRRRENERATGDDLE